MRQFLVISFAISLALISSGCVRRVVTIDSQPQGAMVYFDHQHIGQTPCSKEFLHYGGYHLELTKDGHKNLNTTLKLRGPIYEYFPLSVIAELLIPWQITDQHSFNFKLEKGQGKKALIYPIEQPQPPLSAPQLERIKER